MSTKLEIDEQEDKQWHEHLHKGTQMKKDEPPNANYDPSQDTDEESSDDETTEEESSED